MESRPSDTTDETVYEKVEVVLQSDAQLQASEYWSNAAADVEGMLGGFAHLHAPDISASKSFLSHLRKSVDMEDVVSTFIQKSSEYIGNDPRMGEKFIEGLQSFEPPVGRYDLIWIQWVSGHLTDSDFVAFFARCKNAVKPGGCIVLKDNISKKATPDFDPEDHSWTRPEQLLLKLFAEAGLEVVAHRKQTGFPAGMYTVKMFALK